MALEEPEIPSKLSPVIALDQPTSTALAGPGSERSIRRIISSYDSKLVRAYSLVRFRIIRGRFLEELEQFLPAQGRVLEIGCGFGLFGLYFASGHPNVRFECFDLNEGRIECAQRSARRLGLRNIDFVVGDARAPLDDPGTLDGAYMLDLVHHIPPESARRLLRDIYRSLRPGGVLILKDVDTRPRYKMAFTWLLDVAMTKGEFPDYWSRTELTAELEDIGFTVFRHALVDSLPYPHMLYVCIKPVDDQAG